MSVTAERRTETARRASTPRPSPRPSSSPRARTRSACALRLKDDEFSITWAEYADKVRRTRRRARRARPGARRHASAIMLTNRPEFHWFDAAALHLGATPFSIYNTYAPEQIEYLLQDAGTNIVVTEQAFLDRTGSAAWST